MNTETTARTKRETTARDWLLIIGAGVLVFVLTASGTFPDAAPLGALLVVLGVLGLGWRLVRDR